MRLSIKAANGEQIFEAKVVKGTPASLLFC